LKIRRLAAGAAAAAMTTGLAAQAFAADTMGQPTDGAIDFQPAATQLRQQAMDFHDKFLLWILVAISLLVLSLLLWCVFRYNKRANPTPARFTHNTLVEVLWTTLPVLILLTIAIPSFRLLFDYHDMPAPYMTVKVTGYQWYWGYEYPDQKIPEQISNLATEQQAQLDHIQYKLDATNPMIVPVGKVVRVLVTDADVILLAGTPLDFRMGYGRRLNPKAKIVIMDMDYRNVGNNRDFDYGLVGNLRTIVDAMCDASPGDKTGRHDPFLEMLRADETKAQGKNDKIIAANEVPIHPVRLCHEINEFLEQDTVYIGDGGDIVTFSGSVVRPHKPGGWMDPGPLGTLGVGTGFAMASKLAQPERDVVVLYGDCSFTLTGFDFITMVHRKLPYVGVIGNNSSWNQIRFGQERKYPGRGDIGNVVGDVRFDRLAESMGGFGIRVTKPQDIRPALEKARDSGMPALVDVVINRDVYSSGTSNQTMYK
jgi:heme/copper-type cytochrome/quinol oxidase subunit 2